MILPHSSKGNFLVNITQLHSLLHYLPQLCSYIGFFLKKTNLILINMTQNILLIFSTRNLTSLVILSELNCGWFSSRRFTPFMDFYPQLFPKKISIKNLISEGGSSAS